MKVQAEFKVQEETKVQIKKEVARTTHKTELIDKIWSNIDETAKDVLLQQILTFVQCPICLETLDKPIQCETGHTFCCACIKKWNFSSHLCPLCKQEIRDSASIQLKDIILCMDALLLGVDAKMLRKIPVKGPLNSQRKCSSSRPKRPGFFSRIFSCK